MIDTDRRYNNPNQEDEAKVRFLKENIAKDLNVAVMCLAHTIKVGRGQGGESPKPRLSDLRGSGQVAAHADFVAMAWNPGAYMSEDDRDLMDDVPEEGDMELLWVKNRFGSPSSAPYRFDAPKMRVTPR
jgi:replicative DNA helicase